MTFFEDQAKAKRHTFVLVLLYFAALALIILAGSIVVGIGFVFSQQTEREVSLASAFSPGVFGFVTAAVLMVVGVATLIKLWQLRRGGAAVAETLGATQIMPGGLGPDERRLQNIVEEMAVASGIPVPPLYVMRDEQAINAFAAGYAPRDAVVAVTRGCMELLSRDELQGVVAHEFSHVCNGDMRLNIRLLGLLHGILALAMTGRLLLRMVSRRRGSRRSDKGDGFFFIAGLGLVIIGYIGLFFGRLIQAAISRQREYLADASAVQYTRNPAGIAGALKKIGGLVQGSTVKTSRAEETAHFFFAEGVASALANMFATHPPLADRIRRLDPGFEGEFAQQAYSEMLSAARSAAAVLEEVAPLAAAAAPQISGKEVVSKIGTLSPKDVTQARTTINRIPEKLAEMAREPLGATLIIYGLLLHREPAVQSKQLALLQQKLTPQTYHELERVRGDLNHLAPELLLPLASLTPPALSLLSVNQYQDFRAAMRSLVQADQQCTIFEYALQMMIYRQVECARSTGQQKPAQLKTLHSVSEAVVTLLAALGQLGNPGDLSKAALATQAGLDVCDLTTARWAGVNGTLSQVDAALQKIDHASYEVKQKVIEACVTCIMHDRRVTVEESELIRAIGDSLGCPIPAGVSLAGS